MPSTPRLPPAVALVALAALLAAGCGEIREISGAVVTVQACEDAIAATTELTAALPTLTGRPGEMERALTDAAEKLDRAAEQAGDRTLRESLEGLAGVYREADVGDPAVAVRRVSADTAKYLQVITASCAGQ